MWKISLCLLAGGLLALGACSDESANEPTSTTGGSGGTLPDGSGGSGGGTPNPSGAGGTYINPPVFDELLITVEQGTTARGFPFSRAGATFSRYGESVLPHLETKENCALIDFRGFEGYPAWTPTVGTITISDSRSRAEKNAIIVMEPLLQPGRLRAPQLYDYQTPPLEAPRWAPLDRLLIVADGAELQDFQAAFVFPETVEVTSIKPRRASGNVPTLRRDQEHQFSWNPVDEQVGVYITQFRRDALDMPEYTVRCSFLGHLGFGRISPAVLAGLDTDDMLTPQASRTEVFAGGQRVAQVVDGMHGVWVTVSYGRTLLVNVE